MGSPSALLRRFSARPARALLTLLALSAAATAMAGCATVALLGSILFMVPLTRLYGPAVRAARAA